MEKQTKTINPNEWLNQQTKEVIEMETQPIEQEWKDWANDNFNTKNIEEADFNLSNILAKQRQKENPIILDFD